MLADLKMASLGDVCRAVAEGAGYGYVDLDTYPIDVDVAQDVMTAGLARTTMSLAIRREGDELLVACARPHPLLDMVLAAHERRYTLVLATDDAVMAAIERVYSGGLALASGAETKTLALLFTCLP